MTPAELVGTALGELHMSLDDVRALTPAELEQIWAAHIRAVETENRTRWEQLRTHAWLTILPHISSQNRPTPQQILLFPWDTDPSPVHPAPPSAPVLTRDQLKARIQQLEARLEKVNV